MQTKKRIDKEIQLRYRFSNYLIDPNRFRFRKVVRILGLVLTFLQKISKNINRIQKKIKSVTRDRVIYQKFWNITEINFSLPLVN